MASRSGAVHVSVTRREYKGKVYESTLLRRSYREDGKVKSETVGNLSHLPAGVIDLVRRSLNGEVFVPAGDVEIVRSRAHGHVRLILALVRALGLDRMLGARPTPERQLALALIIGRLIFPASKLASVRVWEDTTLLEELGIQGPWVCRRPTRRWIGSSDDSRRCRRRSWPSISRPARWCCTTSAPAT